MSGIGLLLDSVVIPGWGVVYGSTTLPAMTRRRPCRCVVLADRVSLVFTGFKPHEYLPRRMQTDLTTSLATSSGRGRA